MKVGAVGALRQIKNAIGVARVVLERTRHTLIVGSQATELAAEFGFPVESLSTNKSVSMWKAWEKANCQPNFWKNVKPDPDKSCGPYQPVASSSKLPQVYLADAVASDTIGILAIDESGHVVAGTTTNGANHKIPGRVGDSPIPGSGAYADNEVGAAVATGDGDVMMRFLPTYQAVENMRRGMTPDDAAKEALHRIVRRHPSFEGAIATANRLGQFGAACHGFKNFPYSVWNPDLGKVTVKYVDCQ